MNDMLCVQIQCFFVSHWLDVSRDIMGFLLHGTCIVLSLVILDLAGSSKVYTIFKVI